MNDIVRYDVYFPERDRREFRYLFPAVFLYVLLYIADVGAYVFGVERTVIAFIGGIAPDEAGVIIDQPAKFVRRVGILGHCIFFMEHPINPVCDNRIERIHRFGSCRRFATFQFLPCIFGGLNVGEIIGEFLSDQTEQPSINESSAAPACGCWCAGLRAFPVLRHVRTGSDAVVRFLP